MGFQSSRRGRWLGKRAESVEVLKKQKKKGLLFFVPKKRDKQTHTEGKRKELVNYDLEASGFAM